MSDTLVIFKSIPEFYEKERDGRKPNTERIISYNGDDDFALAKCQSAMNEGRRAKVEIICTGIAPESGVTGEMFFRTITDISLVGTILGKVMVVISWEHEDGMGEFIDGEAAPHE